MHPSRCGSTNLDILDNIPPERIVEAESQFGDKYGTSPSSSFTYLGIPQYLPEYGGEENTALRQALSLAIDRQTLVDTIFDGTREPAHSWVAPVIPGSREDACDNAMYDPERAQQLFEEAGGFDGPMTVWFNSGAGHEDWVEAVTNMWRETLGISDFQFQTLQFAEYLPKLDNQEVTGPFRLGWGMDYPSPQNYLEPLYSAESIPPGGSNTSFYTNEEFDSLLAEGNSKESLDEAIPLYQQAEDLLCEDMPTIPIFFGQNQFVAGERVQDLYVDAFGNINYSEVTATE